MKPPNVIIAVYIILLFCNIIPSTAPVGKIYSYDPPSLDKYLTLYESTLDRIIAHMDAEISMAYTRWNAIDDTIDMKVLRFDLTLAVFVEAFKITGKPQYLEIINKVIEKGIQHLYNPRTHLFAQRWYVPHHKIEDGVDILWALITT